MDGNTYGFIFPINIEWTMFLLKQQSGTSLNQGTAENYCLDIFCRSTGHSDAS